MQPEPQASLLDPRFFSICISIELSLEQPYFLIWHDRSVEFECFANVFNAGGGNSLGQQQLILSPELKMRGEPSFELVRKPIHEWHVNTA